MGNRKKYTRHLSPYVLLFAVSVGRCVGDACFIIIFMSFIVYTYEYIEEQRFVSGVKVKA